MSAENINRQSIKSFVRRHIGPRVSEQNFMLDYLGLADYDDLYASIVPKDIHSENAMDINPGKSEQQALSELKDISKLNKVYQSYIGMGYYNTITPSVILRNIFENPAWYTSYTPYQPEISQGRLEALVNFQTMVADLTGFDIANASMLDEATAAAEAMTFCQRASNSKSMNFFVSKFCHPQTISVVKTRAKYLGINVIIGDEHSELKVDDVFGVLLQYPNTLGNIDDFSNLITKLHENKAKVAVAADLLALTILTPPAELGADIAVGTTQRFGVPLGFGGPHAAYMATTDKDKRNLPGRIVGVSIDSKGKPAYRLALQTREQHIRREKATSNICTAQALLAIMAGAYAVYHGPEKLKEIATTIMLQTSLLKSNLLELGFAIINEYHFDTLTVDCANKKPKILSYAYENKINLRDFENTNLVGISLDETTTYSDLQNLINIFSEKTVELSTFDKTLENENFIGNCIPETLIRTSKYMAHPVFNSYHSETAMMRYLRKLADFDLALDRTMIPLGSCTMKLNAASEMIPVSWPEFNSIHPFAPTEQTLGYQKLFADLEKMLCECTGYEAMSLQPNSGAQGEYAGLLAINAYHESIGQGHRNICLIPQSAHGTNPASAALANMKVIVVACDGNGNVDIADLRAKAELHKDNLSAIMVTYPSTHGVFESAIREICSIIHDNGGQVYLDGANLAAQVGLAAPGKYGADVSHLNLHKTFAIPHGGGGPGVGPVGVRSHLAPFLPNHDVVNLNRKGGAVCAAPWGSASVLPITWMYITMMGRDGLTEASLTAILNANYIAKKLSDKFSILYKDNRGFVAHECIVDVREFKDYGVSVDDIAKRLMDFGFHAPTMSFPVPGTLMIEPTESENLAELDRFCKAMLHIHNEIDMIKSGQMPADNNPLVNAPHTIADLVVDWDRPYSKEIGVYPDSNLKDSKYFTPVNRIDNAYGDRHLICTCPPITDYQ